MLKLQIGQPMQVNDLAEALDGNHGTFHAECGGQGFVVTSAKGHSIVALRPVGRRIVEQPSPTPNLQRTWIVEKLSEDTLNFSEEPSRR